MAFRELEQPAGVLVPALPPPQLGKAGLRVAGERGTQRGELAARPVELCLGLLPLAPNGENGAVVGSAQCQQRPLAGPLAVGLEALTPLPGSVVVPGPLARD